MDSNPLAKSKRAHTQHHSKKSHSVHKPKGPGLSEKNLEKLPGNQTKSPVQSRRISALPSNWDRYDDEVDESGVFSISQPTDVVVPRSKGADYLHLKSEAQAEFQSKIDISSDCLSPVDDLLHAIVIPTQVNYVGKAGNICSSGYKLDGSSYVISKHISNTWLWDRVRISGGAYGGDCHFNSHSGVFSFLSYRDPNLLKTLNIYDGTGDFLRGLRCRYRYPY